MLEHDKDELAALRETVKNLSDLVLEHLVKPEVEEETPPTPVEPCHLDPDQVRAEIAKIVDVGGCYSAGDLAVLIYGKSAVGDPHKKQVVTNNARTLHERGDLAKAALYGKGGQERPSAVVFAKDVITLVKELRPLPCDNGEDIFKDVIDAYWEAADPCNILDVDEEIQNA